MVSRIPSHRWVISAEHKRIEFQKQPRASNREKINVPINQLVDKRVAG
jgi:hypothetical protein